jgi:SAM-dependent methyltransferase
MWDKKYSKVDYAYGLNPNDFLKDSVKNIPKQGNVLLLGDGEGRNGVWLAQQGFDVTSLDGSQVGLNKALKLAEDKKTSIKVIHADLNEYQFEYASWDAIISIWCHIPSELRVKIHQESIKSLKQGGVFILEAYTPNQLGKGTGGPPVKDLLVTLDSLNKDFAELTIINGQEVERDIQEGQGHSGMSSSVQFIGLKK